MALDAPVIVARGLPFPAESYSAHKDGRLFTHSGADTLVLLVDPARHRVDTLGREGKGPGEYTLPNASRALADGRVAILDAGTPRLTIWTVDGKLDSIMAVPPFSLHFDVALDPYRRIYWGDAPSESPMFQSPGDRPGRHPDSTWLYRLSPPSERFDTVASLIQREAAWIRSAYKLPLLYGARDAWGILSNGTMWDSRDSSRPR